MNLAAGKHCHSIDSRGMQRNLLHFLKSSLKPVQNASRRQRQARHQRGISSSAGIFSDVRL